MQAGGCWALGRLAARAHNTRAGAYAAHVGAAGGVDRILAAMDNHTAAAHVQHEAAAALAHLARDEQIQLQVAALGGIERLLRALANHSSSAPVQVRTGGLRRHAGGPRGRRVARVCPRLRAVCKHASRLTRAVWVVVVWYGAGGQQHACAALGNIAVNPINQVSGSQALPLRPDIETICIHVHTHAHTHTHASPHMVSMSGRPDIETICIHVHTHTHTHTHLAFAP